MASPASEMESRVALLERTVYTRLLAQVDSLQYNMGLVLQNHPEISAQADARVGGVILQGTVAKAPRDPDQDWVWIDSRADEIGYGAFGGKEITRVVFSPNISLKVIGGYAFNNCKQLKKFKVPASVVSIGNWAFRESGVVSVSFEPGSVLRSIGLVAFFRTGLEKVEIPASVMDIGEAAFAECASLETISFGLNSKLSSIGPRCFQNCKALRQIEIPPGVFVVPIWCFLSCEALESVVFASQSMLNSIAVGAFMNCLRLKTITLPPSLQIMGGRASEGAVSNTDGAFQGCAALTEVMVVAKGSALVEIGESCFAGCVRLQRIGAVSKLKWIGPASFAGCAALLTPPLPSVVEGIGDSAFSGCGSIVNVQLPATLRALGARAFENCVSLASVHFARGARLRRLGEGTFIGCTKLSQVTLPSALKSFTTSCFPLGCQISTSG